MKQNLSIKNQAMQEDFINDMATWIAISLHETQEMKGDENK